MRVPGTPEDEQLRLSTLSDSRVVYSPAEERFDRITRLACQSFNVPIALISLLNSKCQWFKSAQGLLTRETPREISLCAHAIMGNDVMIVTDTLRNPDFADNPLVTGEPNIRFYAGCPIRAENGSKLGTLCIIDTKPRAMTLSERDQLKSLAAWVEHELRMSTLSTAQMELLNNTDELQRKSLIDPITQVWNASGIQQIIETEQPHAREFNLPYSFMLIDIDHFSNINQQYGNQTGNTVLNEISHRLRVSIRPDDAIARYSNDELLIMLGDCEKNDTSHIAERLITRVSETPVATAAQDISTTVSIGITTIEDLASTTFNAIIETTALALNKAKGNNGNCFEIAAA